MILDDEDLEALGYGPGWDAYADKVFDNYQEKKKSDAEAWMWRYRHETAFRARARAAMRRYWHRRGKFTNAAYLAKPEVRARKLVYYAEYRRKNRGRINAMQRRLRAEKRATNPAATPNQLRAMRAAKKAARLAAKNP